MDTLRYLIIVLKIFSCILGIILIYWLILKITGHSPTTDQIIFGYLLFLTTFMVKMFGEMRELKGKLSEFIKRYDAESSIVS